MLRPSLLIVLIFLLTTPVAFGQAQFLKQGMVGLGISGFYRTNGDEGVVGATIGFAPSTEFDIGISLGGNSAEYDNLLYSSLFLNAWIANENNGRTPISLRFMASVDSYWYPNRGEARGAINIGTAVHKNIVLSESLQLQPFVGLGRAMLDGDESLFKNGHWSFLAGFSFFTGPSPKHTFILSNGYSVIDDQVTINLNIGYLLGFDSGKSSNQ